MRGYNQYCGLARALDVVGDRWSLLIVRELLIRDGARYTDLLHGLPGIATNLLADRVRELERAGIVSREDAPPPVATTLFSLTTRGRELEPALLLLGKWGAPLLARSSAKNHFRSHWLLLPLRLHLKDRSPKGPPLAVEVRTGGEAMTIQTADGALRIRLGAARDPDAVLTGKAQAILGLLGGGLSLRAARAAGIKYQGDTAILNRIIPAPSRRTKKS